MLTEIFLTTRYGKMCEKTSSPPGVWKLFCTQHLSYSLDNGKIVISKSRSSVLTAATLLDAILPKMDGLLIKCTAVKHTTTSKHSTLLVKFNGKLFELNCSSSKIFQKILDIIPLSLYGSTDHKVNLEDIRASWYPFHQYKTVIFFLWAIKTLLYRWCWIVQK